MWRSEYTNCSGRSLLEALDVHDLVVLNTTTPTHFSLTRRNAWSLLDLVLVSSTYGSLTSFSISLSYSYCIFETSVREAALEATPGPDNICYEMFKHMSIKSLEVMLQLFNKIWFTGKIPPSWLHSIVVPIPKHNKPMHLPSSYRPISLTSNVCKIFEKMIVCRLN